MREVLLFAPLALTSCPQAGPASRIEEAADEKVIQIPETPWSALLTTSGVLATWLSHIKSLDREKFAGNEVEFTLTDGTRIGGLLFAQAGEAPLVVATFGFLADRWSKPVAQFVDDYVTRGALGAHILILDHPSSAPFFATNGELSIGGLDEGLMLLEVARRLRNDSAKELGLRVRSLHLLGVSLGGLGVLYAVREDGRNSEPIVDAAAVFSAATRLDEVATTELLSRGRVSLATKRARAFSPTALLGAGIFRDLRGHFRESYLERTGRALDWSNDEMGQRLYDFMERRVRRLSREGRGRFEFDSLEDYMDSMNACDLSEEAETPVALIHAADDPVVPVSHLECVEERGASNPNVSTLVTGNGGHWGFARTYGREWVEAVLEEMLRAGQSR